MLVSDSYQREILPHIGRITTILESIFLVVYVGIYLGYSPKGTQLFLLKLNRQNNTSYISSL